MPQPQHDYTITQRATRSTGQPSGWAVYISPSTSYGYFEHDDAGEGGGLWFKGADGKQLVDYDGVFELPRLVAVAIVQAGYRLGDCGPDTVEVLGEVESRDSEPDPSDVQRWEAARGA